MAIVNTTLNVGLLSIPVGLSKVAEMKEPTFDRASKNGNAIARIEVDSVTGERLGDEEGDIIKGVFEDAKSKTGFKEIPAEKILEINEATKIEEFNIDAFVPLAEVPFERAVGCYMVKVQKGANAKPLKILHDALLASGKAGVFKLALRSRQQPAVIYAKNGGLFVNTLVFAQDFTRGATAGEQLAAVAVEPKMVAVAVDLIENMTTTVAESLDTFQDDVRDLREQLIQDALAGKKIAAPKKAAKKAVAASDEDPLMAALKASVAESGKKASSKKAAVAA